MTVKGNITGANILFAKLLHGIDEAAGSEVGETNTLQS